MFFINHVIISQRYSDRQDFFYEDSVKYSLARE